MAYCLDANTFIQARNQYYGFDICPAFWDWLDVEAEKGTVLSIEPVANLELEPWGGELSTWGLARIGGLFRPMDVKANALITGLTAWANTNAHFTGAAKREFNSSVDLQLIAFAKAHGHTLVTLEVRSDAKKKIKIPTVCDAFDVPTATTFEMLQRLKARFVLKR